MASFHGLAFTSADAAHNMAADHVALCRAAHKGIATLRFYGWTQATLSLGYFQAASVRHCRPGLAQLPWVRRASGGTALVHHHELTYALALPPGFSAGWMPRMHRRILMPALDRFGLRGHIDVVADQPRNLDEILCFRQHAPGDLLCAGHKVTGSAQRKYRQALLQHGAIMLARSEYAPELPGIMDLAGVDLSVPMLCAAIVEEFRRETGWEPIAAGEPLDDEDEAMEKWVKHYESVAWNEKR